ncbi:ComF family protein [Pelagibius litoralis]|uniref:ComF family protein n=1 Tax=Pelagibius litoralis TaxID=374515 RepID=A0A967F2A5_9PROT|nr:ComF family protein [Pelagibius litoralis]NIA71861.1 ComF family protein [Pelagibius litoralis]
MNDGDEIGGAQRPAAFGRLGRSWRAAVDLILPPRCLSCGRLVAEQGALCVACWAGMTFVTDPQCSRCGLPFDHDPGGVMACGACLRAEPPFERARAVLRYDEASRRLILGFKHADRTEAVGTFALWAERTAAELIADCDIIAPVPLHWRRLFKRRYNQAAILSEALARRSGLPGVPDLMVRRRATPSQGRLTAEQRRRNVAGAFAVRPAHLDALRGRRLLLVDDVMTTGATLAACSRAALSAGARAVDVVVLARALRD